MEVKELYARIEQINQKVRTLNADAQRNMGRKEQLIAQRDKAIKEYADKYGVNLTPETLESELNNVISAKEQEASVLESALQLIAENKFDDAKALIEKAEAEAVAPVQPTVAQPAQPTQPAASTVSAPAQPPVQQTVVQPAQPVAPPPVQPAQPTDTVVPSAPPAVSAPAEPRPAPPPAFNPNAGVGAPAFNPEPSTKAAESVISSFEDILKGTNFLNK